MAADLTIRDPVIEIAVVAGAGGGVGSSVRTRAKGAV